MTTAHALPYTVEETLSYFALTSIIGSLITLIPFCFVVSIIAVVAVAMSAALARLAAAAAAIDWRTRGLPGHGR